MERVAGPSTLRSVSAKEDYSPMLPRIRSQSRMAVSDNDFERFVIDVVPT